MQSNNFQNNYNQNNYNRVVSSLLERIMTDVVRYGAIGIGGFAKLIKQMIMSVFGK